MNLRAFAAACDRVTQSHPKTTFAVESGLAAVFAFAGIRGNAAWGGLAVLVAPDELPRRKSPDAPSPAD